jgi:hypothetical protein
MDLKIPDQLRKTVIGYMSAGPEEYEFFIQGFPFQKIRINVSKVRKTDKYLADSNYRFKFKKDPNRYVVATGISDLPDRAIMTCLEKILNQGEILEFKPNKSYTGKPC